MNTIDPREEISHEIDTGQQYKDERNGDDYELVYVDTDIVLMKYLNGENGVLTKRRLFEKNVGSGRYKVQGEVEQVESEGHTPIQFEEVTGIGATSAAALRSSGYSTVEDIQRASNEELKHCRGIGDGNLSNLRDTIEEMK